MKEKNPTPKIFTQESVETPKHDDMLILFSKESSLLKETIEQYLKRFKGMGGKFDLKIINWIPEEAIVNNKYYIGSVDLYTEARIGLGFDSDGDQRTREESFVFEFKPKIKSFSEVLRQINVYKEYFKQSNFIVITYSDIDKFKECFESQSISIIKLKQNK